VVLRDSKAPDDPGAFVSCYFFKCSEVGGINRQRGSLLRSWSCADLGLDKILSESGGVERHLRIAKGARGIRSGSRFRPPGKICLPPSNQRLAARLLALPENATPTNPPSSVAVLRLWQVWHSSFARMPALGASPPQRASSLGTPVSRRRWGTRGYLARLYLWATRPPHRNLRASEV